MSGTPRLDGIKNWLSLIVAATASNFPASETRQRINSLADLLIKEFHEPHAFTPDSARFVAGECKFFPSFSELSIHVRAYLAKTAPPHAVILAGRDDQSLTMADRSMLVFWGEYKSQAKPLPEGVTLSGWLSMCRAHVPGAFKYLVRHDDAAAAIAIRKGWDVPLTDAPARRREPSEGEVLSVEDAVKRAMQAIAEAKMRQGVDPTSAHSFSQIDEDTKRRMANWEKVKAQREAQTGRKFGSVSDAEIKATRDADPRVQAARRVQAEQRAAAPPEADSDAPRMPWEDSR